MSITEALRVTIPSHAVISLTGSGGKTTLLFAWARELAASGKRVIITTTTHMANPECTQAGSVSRDSAADPSYGINVIFAESCTSPEDMPHYINVITRSLDESGIVMIVSHDPVKHHKVSAPPEILMQQLRSLADAVLIEADGSRSMPLKWPATWEPVVPENSDITVCIAGLSSLGRDPADVMYRFDELPDPFRKKTVDEAFIGSVLASRGGGQKGARGEFRVFLNQADTPEVQLSAARIQQLLGLYGIQSAWGRLK